MAQTMREMHRNKLEHWIPEWLEMNGFDGLYNPNEPTDQDGYCCGCDIESLSTAETECDPGPANCIPGVRIECGKDNPGKWFIGSTEERTRRTLVFGCEK